MSDLNAPELPAKRWTLLLIALALTCGYFFFVHSYGGPAHPGVDQNGYQYGGRMFAQTFSTGVKPATDFVYVGWMYVRAPDGWYYPKYPLGLPVIDAICLWTAPLFGADGVAWVYLVSPICMAMSVLAMFLMVRLAAGSFGGILAMILLATCPVALVLANNSNSHAPALAFVTWGILFLLWWWKYGGAWRGAIAGFLLGYALTIRYTEGLVLLPLVIVVLLKHIECSIKKLRFEASYGTAALSEPSTADVASDKAVPIILHHWSGLVESKKRRKLLSSFVKSLRFFAPSWCIFVPIIAWLVPVAILFIYNKAAMGSWTGYDTTNESTGFSMKNFQDKWEFMLDKLNGSGLFFFLPLAVFGLTLMFRSNWRLALVMTAWFVPGVLLYTSYYWGNDLPGMAYIRFFLTLFPPAIFATAWLFGHVAGEKAIAAPIAAGVIVAIAAGVNLYGNMGALERDFAMLTNLADVGHHLRTKIPDEPDPARRPLLFGDQRQLLNFIQWAGNYECYAQDAFNTRFAQRIASGADPDAPNPLQRARIQYTAQVYKGKSDADLVKQQNQIVSRAIMQGRRVFVALPASFIPMFKNRYVTSGFTTVTIEKWREPAEMSAAGKKSLANLGFAAGLIYGRGTPQNWELMEIKRK